jgi:putative ABC transport system substrate-binding protein
MRRRNFISLLGSAVGFGSLSVWAQQSLPLIAVLEGASAASTTARYDAFRAELRQLGYVEGRNCSFEYRYADGFLERLPALAAELVGSIRA